MAHRRNPNEISRTKQSQRFDSRQAMLTEHHHVVMARMKVTLDMAHLYNIQSKD